MDSSNPYYRGHGSWPESNTSNNSSTTRHSHDSPYNGGTWTDSEPMDYQNPYSSQQQSWDVYNSTSQGAFHQSFPQAEDHGRYLTPAPSFPSAPNLTHYPPTQSLYHPYHDTATSVGGNLPQNTGYITRPTTNNAFSHCDQFQRVTYGHRDQQRLFKEAALLPSLFYAGHFIPQNMYKPHTTSDRRRYVEDVPLDAPIYFSVDGNRNYGISLLDALHSRVRNLQYCDDPMFEGRGPSVSIRLEWPGYGQWSRQIPTKDFRTPPMPITRAKLAKSVARCVERFIIEHANERSLEEDTDGRWRVGTEPNTIRLEDLVLVSMHHVSMGSWQPQLRLIA